MNSIWILLVGVLLIGLSVKMLFTKPKVKNEEKMDLFTQITTGKFLD